MTTALTKQDEGWQSQLSLQNLKKYICPKADEKELYFFFNLCKTRNLNPFMREAYLVKFGNEPAQMIVSKDAFLKRADNFKQYNGFEAGLVVTMDDETKAVTGSIIPSGAELVGGWAKVHRKDRAHPVHVEVSLDEYLRLKNDGTPMALWKTKPATMIRKVALVHALREAFPSDFSGMHSEDETGIDMAKLPSVPIDVAATGPAKNELNMDDLKTGDPKDHEGHDSDNTVKPKKEKPVKKKKTPTPVKEEEVEATPPLEWGEVKAGDYTNKHDYLMDKLLLSETMDQLEWSWKEVADYGFGGKKFDTLKDLFNKRQGEIGGPNEPPADDSIDLNPDV